MGNLGNIDFLTTLLMCKREKGLSDDKILAKYYSFYHFLDPGLGTDQIFCSGDEERLVTWENSMVVFHRHF